MWDVVMASQRACESKWVKHSIAMYVYGIRYILLYIRVQCVYGCVWVLKCNSEKKLCSASIRIYNIAHPKCESTECNHSRQHTITTRLCFFLSNQLAKFYQNWKLILFICCILVAQTINSWFLVTPFSKHGHMQQRKHRTDWI